MGLPDEPAADSGKRWLEALHDAIVTDRDSAACSSPKSSSSGGDYSSTEAMPAPSQVAAFRACLQLVERVRRARIESAPTPAIHAIETLGGSLTSDTPKRIGRFEILRDLGRGGHGIVFLARDPTLDRQVALKVPRPEMLLTPDTRSRFLREAHAAARLSHPHIVAVHEVGDGSPICYIAADYCPGETLHGYLRSHPTPLPPRAAATVCAELASAVQYAHDNGVLHRDLKPGNVLLAPRRNATVENADFPYEPRLTDFGLARLTEYDAEQTRTGALVGTPAYMSPEQAEGRVHDTGPPSDIYGLGAVLYEMLTCRPPFRGMTDVDTLRKVLHEEPVRPRSLRRDVPRELEAICLRALEKNPRKRYSSAQAMAVDLRNYLRGVPVDAKAPTPIERLAKWSRRNPALAAAWVLGALLICVLIWSNLRVRAALEATEEQAEIAQTNERIMRRQAYVADIRLAGEAWEQAQPKEARELLARYLPGAGQEDLRGPEWRHLMNRIEGASQLIAKQPSKIWSLVVSTENGLCATGDDVGVVRVWQISPPRLLQTLVGHEPAHVDALVFSGDDKSLYSGGNDGIIWHWDIQAGRPLRHWKAHEGWIGALALSRDEEHLHLASGGSDGRVMIWNSADGSRISECKPHDGAVRWLAFHRNCNWLASAAVGKPVHLEYFLDLSKGTDAENEVLEPQPESDIRVLAMASDGKTIWGVGNELVGWDITSTGRGKVLGRWPLEPNPKSLIEYRGRLIAAYEAPPVIRVHDVEHDNALLFTFRGHSDAVRCLAESERGTFVSGSEDGTLRKWWLDGRKDAIQRLPVPYEAEALRWSRDGRQLNAVLRDGSQWTRTGADEPVHGSFLPNMTVGGGYAIARDDSIISIDDAGGVRWTRFGEPAPPPRFFVPPQADWPTIDGENRRFACGDDQNLLVVDAVTGSKLWEFNHPVAISQIAFLPDDRLITGCQDGVLRVFRASNGDLLADEPIHRRSIKFWQLIPERQQLLTSSEDSTICLVDLKTLKVLRRNTYSQESFRAYSIAGGSRILVCSLQGFIFLDSASGQVLLSIAEPIDPFTTQLSPDGRSVAAILGDRSIVQFRIE
jgi:WD40 repeat protein